MSADTIEIYVRQSGGDNLPHVYASDDAKAATAKTRETGLPTAFVELTVLPEWITDERQRQAYEKAGKFLHLRIPIHGDLPL